MPNSTRVTIALLALLVLLFGCAEPPPCDVMPGLASDHHGNAVCVVTTDRGVLLVQRRFHGDFGLPGGRRSAGESSQCTAARETWEETGIAIVVGPLFERASNTSVYQCKPQVPVRFDTPAPTSWLHSIEIAEASWVPFEELDSLNWRYTDQHDQIRRLTEGTGNP